MAEQLLQMAGPGAQIFVDGFRGGRMPPKEQIQQIRFQTNSYAAEYHEAGMVRVEIITRPGMGNWRGSFNFGFRDESLNARNAFATERGPEQQKRFMFDIPGADREGQDQPRDQRRRQHVVRRADDRGADADRRGQRSGAAAGGQREHQRPHRAGARRRQQPARRVRRAATDAHAISASATSTCPSAPTRPRPSTTRCACATPDVRQEVVQRDCASSSRDRRPPTRPASNAPTMRVLDSFTSGGAGQAGIRDGRQFTVAQNFDFPVKKHVLRAGAEVERRLVGQHAAVQRQRHVHVLDARGLPREPAAHIHAPRRRSQRRLLAVRSRLVHPGRLPADKKINVSLGLRQEMQTHVDDKWNIAPRAAFTWALRKGNVRGGYGMFFDWIDANIYEQTVRVDGTHQIDEIIINPSYPDFGTAPARRCRRAAFCSGRS